MISAASALRSSNAAEQAASASGATARLADAKAAGDNPAVREAFTAAMGQTFYGQMLKAMRQTVHKSEYFHGGRAEEIFQQQLDQIVVEQMSRSSAAPMVEPMYQQFLLNRNQPS